MTGRLYAAALPVLAAHGLVPGPDGFAVVDLVAFAAARGWGVSTDRVAKARGLRRWRAVILVHNPVPVGRAGIQVGGTTAAGTTEAEALAVALASMLRREG
jgi:hypothetical protein